MKLKPKQSIADYFKQISDPRIERRKQHELLDIITIALCAVLCGAETWIGIETYGKAKEEWLKKICTLANGIPSHDTFARVFAAINPEEFQECFLNWVKGIGRVTSGEIIAIDGKQSRTRGNQKLLNDIRGSRPDRSTGKMAKIKQYWHGGVSQNRRR